MFAASVFTTIGLFGSGTCNEGADIKAGLSSSTAAAAPSTPCQIYPSATGGAGALACKVRNQPPVLTHQAQKASYVPSVFEDRWPLGDRLDFLRLRRHARWFDNTAWVFNLLRGEVAFGQLNVETILSHSPEN